MDIHSSTLVVFTVVLMTGGGGCCRLGKHLIEPAISDLLAITLPATPQLLPHKL